MKPYIQMIVAASLNDVIGIKNTLPWKLPVDLQFFKSMTAGATMIMGRKNFDSLKRKPLAYRNHIILSRTELEGEKNGYTVCRTKEDALKCAQDFACPIFIIGGGEIYEQFLPETDKLFLTRVHKTIEDGEVFFPKTDWSQWKRISKIEHPQDERHDVAYTFETWIRIHNQ